MKSIIAAALVVGSASLVSADTSVSIYGGVQTLPHSVTSGVHPETGDSYEKTFGFEGNSLAMPPYYGIRAVKWNQ